MGYRRWLPLREELCGESFAHMEHDYSTHARQQQGEQGDTSFNNSEAWGLAGEQLREWIY